MIVHGSGDTMALPVSAVIGHSLGGAAVLAAAGRIDSVKGVATIGAPADPAHVAHLFRANREEIDLAAWDWEPRIWGRVRHDIAPSAKKLMAKADELLLATD